MPVDDATAIQVEGLKKSFRIPTQRVDSLKERAMHPFAAREYRELQGARRHLLRGPPGRVLRHRRPQRLRQEHAAEAARRASTGPTPARSGSPGALAPFIELGVGFNPELTRPRERRPQRGDDGPDPAGGAQPLDAVIDFAELDDFADLKLKNYSSGMLVRLAFSLMLQVDADVLLIDEVLAVGDAAFQQKCADAFREMKAAGQDDRPGHPRHGDGRGATATARC